MAKTDLPDEDVKNDPLDYSYNDIHNNTARTILSDGMDEKPVVEPEKEEEPEKKVEETASDKVGLDEELKQIAEETARAVVEKQRQEEERAEKERIEAEAKAKKPQDEYQEIVDEFTEREGRTPTWDELAVTIEDRTLKRLSEAQEEKQRVETARQEEIRKAQEEERKRLDSYIDDELSDLYAKNRLTKIKDPENPSDPGVVERKALFDQWSKVNEKRRAEGKPEILSATRIYEFYYKKPNVQPAGADAPIAGNRGSAVAPSAESEYSYDDIRKPWGAFKQIKK